MIIFHNVGVCENAKQALPDDFSVKDFVPDSDEEQTSPEDKFDFILTSLNDSAVKFKTSSIIMSDEESSEKDDGVKETGNKYKKQTPTPILPSCHCFLCDKL